LVLRIKPRANVLPLSYASSPTCSGWIAGILEEKILGKKVIKMFHLFISIYKTISSQRIPSWLWSIELVFMSRFLRASLAGLKPSKWLKGEVEPQKTHPDNFFQAV
jgi:hypothetical protein